MGDGVGGPPRALKKYHQGTCNNFSIQLLHQPHQHLLHLLSHHPPIACTTNSHTHPHTHLHTTDHLHHTNTTTSTTTSTASPTTTSTTTSITTSAPTIFSTKLCSKRRKQSTQITIPKRHAPTLSLFISTNIRLKRHKPPYRPPPI